MYGILLEEVTAINVKITYYLSTGNFGCPGVRVHKGITIVLSLFRSHWLAVVYCLVLCSGSCEPVHEDRTEISTLARPTGKLL